MPVRNKRRTPTKKEKAHTRLDIRFIASMHSVQCKTSIIVTNV